MVTPGVLVAVAIDVTALVGVLVRVGVIVGVVDIGDGVGDGVAVSVLVAVMDGVSTAVGVGVMRVPPNTETPNTATPNVLAGIGARVGVAAAGATGVTMTDWAMSATCSLKKASSVTDPAVDASNVRLSMSL